MLHASHYVSRFLTQPWEGAQRKLTYADLETGQVRRKSSKSLFVAPRGFDTEMERLLSDYVEAPVGRLRKRWLDEGGRPEPTSWPEYRALYLLLALQAAKVTELRDRFGGSSGLDLLRSGEATIDLFAAGLHDQNHLATTVLPEHLNLFMPETGVFPFVVPDRGCATGWTLATGMALHPRILLAMVSKSVTEDVLEWHASFSDHVMALSVGTSLGVRRVVLPQHLPRPGEERALIAEIRRMINRNRLLLRRTFEARELAIKMWSLAGMSLRERQVGEQSEMIWNEQTLALSPARPTGAPG